ncbi:MAG: DUF1648 domain-containing protein [Acidimicrobiia bacterium]
MKPWTRLLLWAGLMLGLSLVPLLVGWPNLPDAVAVHWGIAGTPDGAWSKTATLLLPFLMIAIGLFTTSLFRIDGKPTAEAFAMIGLMGGVSVTLMTILVTLNWGVASWEQAGAFAWWQLALVIAGAGVGALLGYRIGVRWYPPPAVPDVPMGPIIEVAEGEKVSWIGTCSVVWPILLVGGLGVALIFMPGWWKLLAALFVALAFMFARVYVVVSEKGLQVRLGGGVPAKRIPLDAIRNAQAIDLEPAQWAGWGYRVVPGGSALVLRRGDAIHVNLESDRKFAVTVDDAASGAALLNGLVARRERGSS